MRNVYLYGRLAKKFGSHHRLDIQTAGEAIRAFGVNCKGFYEELKKGSYHIVRGKSVDTGLSLDLEAVREFRLGNGDLHIMPVVKGRKNGGLLKVLLGVALVGVGLFMGAGVTAFSVFGMKVSWGSLAMLGAAVAVAGAAQMLSPDEDKDSKKNESYTFGGPGNIYDQGYPVPIIYGRVKTGTYLVSGGIDVEDI